MVEKAAQNAEPGTWITGRGWHQEKWSTLPANTIEGFPVHTKLSRVSAENPVILSHASGHALFANQEAMRISGVDGKTKDPEGGKLVRIENGRPSGVFLENAELLITDVYDTLMSKRPAKEIYDQRFMEFTKAAQHALSQGITSFYDAGSTFEEVDFFKELADAGKIPMRLWLMLHENNEILEKKIRDYRLINYGNNHLTVRAIKRYMDGALGARGAWLLEPYTDQHSTCGLNTIPIEEFKITAEIAEKNGFQLCTHAIGDRANREVLDVYEQFIRQSEDKDLRWRIEHAQHLNPIEVPRFAKLGVIAAMQGIPCTSDGPWVPKRIGHERAEQGAYVWRKLLEAGALVCNGTDAPVESLDPYANIYASISRRMRDGNLFYPEQKMNRMEAIKSYTIDAAYSGFEEELKGSITPGKLADFIVLSEDILSIVEEKIPNVKVLSTYVGGKLVYNSSE